jgi:hypothetical protein
MMQSPIKKIQTGGNYADQMRSIVAPQAAMGSVGVNPMMRKRMKQGGDVQSESSKLDQKNAAMDKEQEEGFKRYQAEQAKEAKANADSRKSMPSFNFGKPEKKAKGGAIKSSASSRGDGIAQRGKTKGRMV